MDPATATTAAVELWKIGGIAAVLLAVIVAGGYLMFRFLIGMIRDLGQRLNEVQDYQTKELAALVRENSVTNQGVIAVCQDVKETRVQLVAAMRDRPCLWETGPHKVVKTPLPG